MKRNNIIIWEECGNITAEQIDEMMKLFQEYKDKYPNGLGKMNWFQGTINKNSIDLEDKSDGE